MARHAVCRHRLSRDRRQTAPAGLEGEYPAPFTIWKSANTARRRRGDLGYPGHSGVSGQAHPEARLWPEKREARARARSAAAEMHSGFAALREHCPMDLLARLPMATLPDTVAVDVRRIVELWQDCRRRHGASGPFLFGGFSATDAMYAPVASRFRTYLPDLAPYGDDGTAQAYVDALFALPAMAEWERGALSETGKTG